MKINKLAVAISTCLYSTLSFQAALADDTEIYVPKELPADQQVRPNIMFILDSSGSMDTEVPNTGNKTRNQVMRSVVNNLIDELKVKEDINVGIMRFKGQNGGYVLAPVSRLTNNNASSLKKVVNKVPADGWTPMSETYYEAYRYFAGKTPEWGANDSVKSSISGSNYISPIEHSCQPSHIIYITDGEPTQDTDSNSDINSLINNKNTTYRSCNNNSNGACLPHLAEYMRNQDLAPAPSFSDPTSRKQTVTSHFVGFAIDLPLLQNAAAAGGGRYYTADNVSGLTDALTAIVADITAENTTFTAPSVAVSAFNNLGYRDDLYYALFRPAAGANWPGNIKRYKLGRNTTTGYSVILDKNGNNAIDDSTGFFSEGASSFWSTGDGKDIAQGGVASLLTNPGGRNLYTYTGANITPTSTSGVTGSTALNALNTTIDRNLMGANSDSERNTFVNWARGKKPDNTNRLAIGDVLHSEPLLLAYTVDENLTRTTSLEQLYMFFGSNDGFLYAIDPNTGVEQFAFMPKELLKNPGKYYKNATGSSNKVYGLDGKITVHAEYSDLTSNRTRTLSKANLYVGMRRGGSNYYALDVSNINAPRLKWTIFGATQTVQSNGSVVTSSTNATPGYEKLGNTFSAAKLAKIKVADSNASTGFIAKDVLVFTGGYDLDQDNIGTNAPKNDDIGNSLYIADAETGKLLWRAGNTGDSTANLQIANMTNSMPADPSLININGDGLLDIIYATDLRGQVFRFDVDNSSNNSTFAGGRIASLAGSNAENNRRFFTTPSVALMRERGGKTYFTISVGSGFRESPLNTDTNDRFYVIRDSFVTTKPTTYTTITESDLTDASGIDLSASQTQDILDEIADKEALIRDINNNLAVARANFDNYKASSGFTAKQEAANLNRALANDKQRDMDYITATDPYIREHQPNTKAQSDIQALIRDTQSALKGIDAAYQAAKALDESADYTSLAAAVTPAQNTLTTANNEYTSAKSISDADANTFNTLNTNATTAENQATTAEELVPVRLQQKQDAQTNYDNALDDFDIKQDAKNDADALVTTKFGELNTAQTNLTAAQTALDSDPTNQTLIDARDAAQNTWNTANTAHTDALAAQGIAAGALGVANGVVGSTYGALTAAIANYDTAVTDANTKRGLATDARNLANTAQNTAATSAGITADKLQAKNDAQTAFDNAVAARDKALKDDQAAASMLALRNQMALELEKLAALRDTVDNAWAAVTAKETALSEAKANPSFDSDQLPTLEDDLAQARQDYEDLASVIKRGDLIDGSADLNALLASINSALKAGDATAIAAALATPLADLQAALGLSGSATLTPEELIAIDEATRAANLLDQATREKGIVDNLNDLATDRDALIALADDYQAEADTIAAILYSGSLLDATDLAAAIQAYAPDDLTMFDAYQFLIDKAIAAAEHPTTGLAKLRQEINTLYGSLTIGNSYTPPTGIDSSKGFYLRLPRGEKVLSNAISFGGSVLFTTFSPRSQTNSTCGSDVGLGRFYAISLTDASAVFTKTVNGVPTPVRSLDLVRPGIPPSPAVVLSPGAPATIVGSEALKLICADPSNPLCKASHAADPLYWREN